MTEALVSILIPAHNAAPFVADTLRSVQAQSYSALEVVVVDDHSTDETRSILKEFSSDPRISYFPAKHHGASAARNQAFYESRGSFVKFLDADDILSPNHIELQLDAIRYDKSSVACSAWGRFYENDISNSNFIPDSSWQTLDALDWLYFNFEHGHQMMQCGMFLIARSLLEKSGLWDETLSLIDDFEFFCRVLARAARVVFVEDALLYYRSDVTSSLSKSRNDKAVDSAVRSVLAGISAIREKEDSKRINQLAANVCQRWAFDLYASHREKTLVLEQAAIDFGGASIELEGGAATRVIASLFGWKIAKRLLG